MKKFSIKNKLLFKFQACEDGDISTIENRLDEGYLNVNDINPIDGATGLHYAADSGNTAVVELLLNKFNAGLIYNILSTI